VGELESALDELAATTAFAGVVRVDGAGTESFDRAYGLASRAEGLANTVSTRFATASATKSLTAVAVMSLVESGILSLDTTARSLLGNDLPLIGDSVTVQLLLAHRSGIGDYCDEEGDADVTDYVLPIPVHELDTTEQYLRVLDGFPSKFPPGEQFAYCNGGYVVLALLAERASGMSFYDLVEQRVCGPAGMIQTAFLRSDELPGGTALGYLHADGLRTNIFHLPVRGTGDGGIYSTLDDITAFWDAFVGGRLVSPDTVEFMVRTHSEVESEQHRYGLGFWLGPGPDTVQIEGADAGVSFRSVRDRSRGLTVTVMSNTTDGAWPIARALREALAY
jgi:CubicO group peptidase (beta-lactamase class C family)